MQEKTENPKSPPTDIKLFCNLVVFGTSYQVQYKTWTSNQDSLTRHVRIYIFNTLGRGTESLCCSQCQCKAEDFNQQTLFSDGRWGGESERAEFFDLQMLPQGSRLRGKIRI